MHWEHGDLITGPPGKSLLRFLLICGIISTLQKFLSKYNFYQIIHMGQQQQKIVIECLLSAIPGSDIFL